MIYDILYIRNFKDDNKEILSNLKDNLNKKSDYYLNLNSEYFSFKDKNTLISGFSRNNYEKNIFENDEFILIIVGEVLSRFDSEYFKGKAEIIFAKEIFDLYKTKGNDFINNIKGNFQIIFHAKKDNKTILYNSKGGVSPFYFLYKDEILILTTAIYLIPDEIINKIGYESSHILEYVIFHYPNFGHTFFKDIYNLNPSEKIIFKKEKLVKENYYDINEHLRKSKISERDATEICTELFGKIVKALVADKNNFCASFTGGFDSRANLAVLKDFKKNMLTYAFGIKGSRNISIPLIISKKEGFNFRPYYLENDFEEKYSDYYEKYIFLSDCLTPLKSPNQLYVIEDLSKFSDLVITGLFGSELIRTFQNANGMIPDYFFQIAKTKDKLTELKNVINDYKLMNIWGTNIFNKQNIELLIENFNLLFLKNNYDNENQFFYNYALKDAFRKYFGSEVQSERLFATNRFPFYDDEFVEFILDSPFSSFNNTYENPTFSQRIKSQKLYANIIKKYYPELLLYDTDHGYKPKDLLSPLPILNIAPKFILKNYIPKKRGYTEYKAKDWTKIQIESKYDMLIKDSIINVSEFSKLLQNGEWQNYDLLEIRKLIAFQIYNNFIYN